MGAIMTDNGGKFTGRRFTCRLEALGSSHHRPPSRSPNHHAVVNASTRLCSSNAGDQPPPQAIHLTSPASDRSLDGRPHHQPPSQQPAVFTMTPQHLSPPTLVCEPWEPSYRPYPEYCLTQLHPRCCARSRCSSTILGRRLLRNGEFGRVDELVASV